MLTGIDKTLRSRFYKVFERFREEGLVNALSDTIASYSGLAKITGLGIMILLSQLEIDYITPLAKIFASSRNTRYFGMIDDH
jgi:hypothetical protein